MPEISKRGNAMPSSPIRKLAPLASVAKSQGVKVYHLNIGQPDLPSPQQALDAIHKVDRKTLEYSPSEGYASLRVALSRYYHRIGIEVFPEEILVTTGGSEAILFAFMACMDPGDEIIMVEPCYANYISMAVTAGIVVKTVTSHIENGFALPPVEEFEKAITPATKAIMLCNPSNPGGTLYTKDELYQLRDIVKRHNLFLMADEVYREFVYSDEPFMSALDLGIDQNVVIIDSVSKRYSECGIRIGALISRNAEVRATVLKFAQARLSPPLLGQIAAEASIDGTEAYSRECFLEYKARRDFFIDALNKIPGVFSPKPEGAFYTIASLPVEDAEDFCRWCLSDFKDNKETIMMAPAAGFYGDPSLGRKQVRLAYVLNIKDLGRCIQLLAKALEQYNKIKK
ncbi:MAG: pyridoxal phosphate-dependent aminotransferase [Bacteroidales bacterium]|nr:pyridoxal phosphate-dependent aminotransferase [Bacteroidales bacterium]